MAGGGIVWENSHVYIQLHTFLTMNECCTCVSRDSVFIIWLVTAEEGVEGNAPLDELSKKLQSE